MTWTMARVIQLKKAWEKGDSAGVIGVDMHITRNAVIGKLHRMGLSRSRPIKRIQRTPKRPTRQLGNGRSRFTPSTEGQDAMAQETFKKVSAASVDDLEIPVAQRKTFEQLQAAMCKFPVGNPGEPDFFFCGAECGRAVSYCDAHAKRCGGRRW